jgi:hexokinase
MFMYVHQINPSDPTDELLMIIGIFTHFFALETTLAERQFFRALAKLIGRRAARLSACGIAAIVGKMGYLDEGCSVGADGSLYNVRRFCSLFAFVCQLINMLSNRNIPGLQIVCMKACLTYLEKKDGKYFHGNY